MEPTIGLSEFLQKYEKDDNEWWRLPCGDHQNLFEEAVEEIERLELRVRDLEAGRPR